MEAAAVAADAASPPSHPPAAWTPPPSVTRSPSPRLRWAVHLPPDTPSASQIATAAAALPDPAARAAVAAFLRPADRARALTSRLLQAAAPAVALPGVAWGAAPIARTAKGGKPYVDFGDGGWAPPSSADWKAAAAPNWNFNASHDGRWVVLAAEPVALVGVDVAAPPAERGPGALARLRGVAELRAEFSACLAPSEWAAVERAGRAATTDAAAAEDAAFRAHWALKEAYTKARGDGLGCDFGGVVFEGVVGRDGSVGGPPPSTAAFPSRLPATPSLRSNPAWTFELHMLDALGHIAAVARGPAADAVDEGGRLVRTLLARGRAPDELNQPPAFTLLAVRDLVPDGVRAAFDGAA